MLITLHDLGRELAAQYDLDPDAAQRAVETYAGQIADDADLYDETAGALSDAGADVVRAQFAADYADS